MADLQAILDAHRAQQAMRLSTKQAAELINCTPRTLELWRSHKEGPPWYRVGKKRVVYLLPDVLEYLRLRTETPPA